MRTHVAQDCGLLAAIDSYFLSICKLGESAWRAITERRHQIPTFLCRSTCKLGSLTEVSPGLAYLWSKVHRTHSVDSIALMPVQYLK